MENDVDKFWSRVKKGADDECWPWLGPRTPRGYGRVYFRRKVRVASRVAMELVMGSEPPQLMSVCHHCDNPICCNPKHLFLGRALENMADAQAKQRIPRARRRTPITVYVDDEVFQRFKSFAVEQKQTVSSILRELLESVDLS